MSLELRRLQLALWPLGYCSKLATHEIRILALTRCRPFRSLERRLRPLPLRPPRQRLVGLISATFPIVLPLDRLRPRQPAAQPPARKPRRQVRLPARQTPSLSIFRAIRSLTTRTLARWLAVEQAAISKLNWKSLSQLCSSISLESWGCTMTSTRICLARPCWAVPAPQD